MRHHDNRPIPARREVRMPLTKKRTLTEKRIAANQANGKRSRGPATPKGRERIRDANLRHGFYSQDRDNALRALGENPQEFDAVVKSVMEKWPPADDLKSVWRAPCGGWSAATACRKAENKGDKKTT